jgi:hypothetical protein
MDETDSCLDDNAVSAYLEHQLPEAEVQGVVAHLASCEHCLAIVCAARDDGAAVRNEIDRFVIEDLIGQTSASDTYRARDPRDRCEIVLDVIHVADRDALRAKIAARGLPGLREVLDRDGALLVVRDRGSAPSTSWLALLDHAPARRRRRWPLAVAAALAVAIAAVIVVLATRLSGSSTPPNQLAALNEHDDHHPDRTAALLAELAADHFTDVVRDGRTMLAEVAAPRAEAFEALAIAYVLIDRGDDATATLERLARIDAAEGAIAQADLAAYAGRLDDALARLGARHGPRADALRAELTARRTGDPSPRGEGPWAEHHRAARTAFAATDLATAERELTWCAEHPGQAALAARPSLRLISEVAIELARCKDARHADPRELRAAYQQVVKLAPAAQRDSWTEQARTRLKELAN